MIVPPFFLYAETHYRFKYFFSFLKKAEPEIITDAPHRLDPSASLPILVLCKDADVYPIHLVSITVTIRQQSKKIFSHCIDSFAPIPISTHYWWHVFTIQFRDSLKSVFGHLQVDVDVVFTQNGKQKKAHNNNVRTSSKSSLNIYRSHSPLPSIPGWIVGDAHTHSTYTEDQVEFGSPIGAGPQLCSAMGLSFFCVTDHSYDLDDTLSSYLINDPALPKWRLLQNEISDLNEHINDFTVIRGEEVSCTNADNHTVHLLLLGNRKYFHGSGDSAEKWFKTKCEHVVHEVIEGSESSSAVYAGHPTEEVPLIQKLLLNRGEWTKADMSHPGLHGIQILNGERSEHFYYGLDVWKWLLLRGEKKFILGGNDAHGNYNRFVQIGIPFISIGEKESQLFGKMKTAVYSSVSEQSIVSAMQSGRTVITNGPLITIEVETESHTIGMIGTTVRGNRFLVKVRACSTSEFGKFKSITIVHGIIGKKEKVFLEVKEFHNPFEAHFITDWESTSNFSYIRAEAFTKEGQGADRDGFCYTNPIWIQSE